MPIMAKAMRPEMKPMSSLRYTAGSLVEYYEFPKAYYCKANDVPLAPAADLLESRNYFARMSEASPEKKAARWAESLICEHWVGADD